MLVRSAGISVFASHLALTYMKKSSPGLRLGSMPVRSTPQAPNCGLAAAVTGGGALAEQAARPPASPARQNTTAMRFIP